MTYFLLKQLGINFTVKIVQFLRCKCTSIKTAKVKYTGIVMDLHIFRGKVVPIPRCNITMMEGTTLLLRPIITRV